MYTLLYSLTTGHQIAFLYHLINPTQVTQIQNVVQPEPLIRETYRVTIQRKCVIGYFIPRVAALGMKYPMIHEG
jgi:hypothetical protein